MHGQFARDIQDMDKKNTCRWMRKSDLKDCTKALICSAQEQSTRTNYIKYNIDNCQVTFFQAVWYKKWDYISYSEWVWQTCPK